MDHEDFIKAAISPACFALVEATGSLDHLSYRAARDMLLGTALVESGLRFVYQHGDGPALGFYQMEERTHDDIWENFLRHRKELSQVVVGLSSYLPDSIPAADEMTHNLRYATAMARVHYLRVPEPLPEGGDWEKQAYYWKKYWNTVKGAGREEDYMARAVPVLKTVQSDELG